MNPTQTEKENRIETADKPAERFAHTNQEKKRSENRRKASQYMKDLNRRNAIGDMLYMVGFWVEYVGVCVRRKVSTVVRGIADTVLNLLLIVLRPILIGLITLIEDLAGPFVRIASGIRHIHELPAQLEDSGAGEVRAAKARYLASGIRKYSVLLWNAITYILPAVAAAALVVGVRGGLGLHFVLNVQVDGEHVGAVESEQVFEKAVKKFLEEIQKSRQPKIYRGKQTLKQLASQNAGLANIEISDKNFKAFTHVAKKYHVDFALKKDTAAEQSRYLVFFKSRDADAITAAFQEFASRRMGREEKPAIRDRLEQAKEQVERKPEHRTLDGEKVKTRDRSVQR